MNKENLWYFKSGHDSDVVVSTRVRLARNLRDYPFEPRLDRNCANEIISRVKNALPESKGYSFMDFTAVDPITAASFAEQHIVSEEFAEKKTPHALMINENEQVYIMVCEEDHLRIQAILSGLELNEAYRRAAAADDLLDESLNIAYSEKLGYLTHCPTNLGTGMRASVMMFLPALTMGRQIRSLQSQLSKLGLTIRGAAGEGSRGDGYLYQISNQVTLGVSEEETLKKLSAVIDKISSEERSLRERLKANSQIKLKDNTRRALGVLLYAEILDSNELTELYSTLRLGVAMGYADGIEYKTLDRLLIECMPATISIRGGGKCAENAQERDIYRAALAREILSGKNN